MIIDAAEPSNETSRSSIVNVDGNTDAKLKPNPAVPNQSMGIDRGQAHMEIDETKQPNTSNAVSVRGAANVDNGIARIRPTV
eukprot:SAG31_NODE_12079_length_970_cov_1.390356_2_plen_81_part_01